MKRQDVLGYDYKSRRGIWQSPVRLTKRSLNGRTDLSAGEV